MSVEGLNKRKLQSSSEDIEESKVRSSVTFFLQGAVLRVGDVVKFGRVPFRVKESSV